MQLTLCAKTFSPYIMCSVANLRLCYSTTRWLIMLCMAIAVFGLTLHLIADAARVPPEAGNIRQCNPSLTSTSSERTATCSIHAGFVLPEIMVPASPLALILALALVIPALPPQLVPSPVRPPKFP